MAAALGALGALWGARRLGVALCVMMLGGTFFVLLLQELSLREHWRLLISPLPALAGGMLGAMRWAARQRSWHR